MHSSATVQGSSCQDKEVLIMYESRHLQTYLKLIKPSIEISPSVKAQFCK